jgi:hypothetical protein
LGTRRAGNRGPSAVAKSLTHGLDLLGAQYDVNPRRVSRVETLGVLSGLDALAEGIALRRCGVAGRLIAGPNLVVLPSEAEELMSAREIESCLVPSAWVKELYERDCAALAGRVVIWPAGVDAGYWSPPAGAQPAGRHAVVFRKAVTGQANASDREVQEACALLGARGFATTLLRYGTFTPRAYRRILRSSELVVYLGASESQGLALVEAWSANVPTLVRRFEELRYQGRVIRCSAAPYLSPNTGAFFADLQELGSLLDRWAELRASFEPRAWVLANMTDEVCARSYLALTAAPTQPERRPQSVSGS